MPRTEVLVIGGGVTGAGVARDLALRGIGVTLVESGDFSAGATGRCHGILHSGGRYAVKDPESAAECAAEGAILRRVADFCVEDTGGLFVGVKGDDPAFLDRFLKGCRRTGVAAREITLQEAFSREPLLSRKAVNAAEVSDASVDPFALTLGNIESARAAGASAFNYHPARKFRVKEGRVDEVIVENRRNGSRKALRPEIVVNASGAWASEVASLAGLRIPLALDKGSLLVLNGRIVNGLVNRLRMPSDGDIIVPNHSASIVGTTAERVSSPSDCLVRRDEVELLLSRASEIVPEAKDARIVRTYAGVRPLLGGGGEGREASRTFRVIDHLEEGVSNMVSIVGGKLTTYRLMAEEASDLVLKKLGASGRCRTAAEPISPPASLPEVRGMVSLPLSRMEKKYGRRSGEVLGACLGVPRGGEMLCSCEEVLRGEAVYFCLHQDVKELSDLMRRTRAGMGYCQGGACAFGMLSVMIESSDESPLKLLGRFMEERWKGVEPVLFGTQLRQEVFKHCLLNGVYGLDSILGRENG